MRNHPAQTIGRGFVDDGTDDRRTPAWLFDPLHAAHRFTIDAAASPANALLPRYWTRADDALSRPWTEERVWCNPPFSDLSPWVAHARTADAAAVVMLLPANRTDQRWWQELIEPDRDRGGFSTRFIGGRVDFAAPASATATLPGIDPPRPRGSHAPFGLVLLGWGIDLRAAAQLGKDDRDPTS